MSCWLSGDLVREGDLAEYWCSLVVTVEKFPLIFALISERMVEGRFVTWRLGIWNKMMLNTPSNPKLGVFMNQIERSIVAGSQRCPQGVDLAMVTGAVRATALDRPVRPAARGGVKVCLKEDHRYVEVS
jgi:hypothetical protein